MKNKIWNLNRKGKWRSENQKIKNKNGKVKNKNEIDRWPPWASVFYGYRLKFWIFYGYRLIFFSYGKQKS